MDLIEEEPHVIHIGGHFHWLTWESAKNGQAIDGSVTIIALNLSTEAG